MQVLFTHLPADTSLEELTRFALSGLGSGLSFWKKSKLRQVNILEMDDPDKQTKEFHGLIAFTSESDAAKAIAALNGKELKGKAITVRPFCHRSPSDQRKKRGDLQDQDTFQERRRTQLRITRHADGKKTLLTPPERSASTPAAPARASAAPSSQRPQPQPPRNAAPTPAPARSPENPSAPSKSPADTAIDKSGAALEQQRFQMLQDIAKELSGDINFPTNFNLIIQLRETLNNPDWELDDVVKLLSVEPLIASRLVGLANSAAYKRGRNEICDVKAAVRSLGINLVRNTAFAIATRQLKNAKSMSVFQGLADWFWEHSLKTASAAFVINKHFAHLPPDEAMLAGMIHDIGAFYLLYRASKYDELCKRPETVKYLIAQWHENMGHAILSSLGLPEELSDAIKEHDTPRTPPSTINCLGDLIYVANLLAGCEQEWQYIDGIEQYAGMEVVDEKFAALAEEVEEYALELRSIFG